MEVFANAWVQGGAVLLLVLVLGYANWLQWKRGVTSQKDMLELTKDAAASAEKFRAAADRQTEALNRNSAALEALTMRLISQQVTR